MKRYYEVYSPLLKSFASEPTPALGVWKGASEESAKALLRQRDVANFAHYATIYGKKCVLIVSETKASLTPYKAHRVALVFDANTDDAHIVEAMGQLSNGATIEAFSYKKVGWTLLPTDYDINKVRSVAEQFGAKYWTDKLVWYALATWSNGKLVRYSF